MRSLYQDLLIHVTRFREPESYDALAREVFPTIVERRPANATGSELIRSRTRGRVPGPLLEEWTTIKTLAGSLAGSAWAMAESACSPPAEPPMTGLRARNRPPSLCDRRRGHGANSNGTAFELAAGALRAEHAVSGR
jgi:hypothetical protein